MAKRRQRPMHISEIGDFRHALELFSRYRVDGPDDGRHGGVDPNVDPAPSIGDMSRGGVNLLRVGDVGHQRDWLAAKPLDIFARAVKTGLTPRQKRDSESSLSKSRGDRASNARRPAGDDGDGGVIL